MDDSCPDSWRLHCTDIRKMMTSEKRHKCYIKAAFPLFDGPVSTFFLWYLQGKEKKYV
jgi:hypothetical protein